MTDKPKLRDNIMRLAVDISPVADIKDRTVFIYLACLYTAAFTPLMLRGGLYRDDIARTVHGYFNWSWAGRPLADMTFFLIQFGRPAVDISPAPQLFAIVFLALAGVVLSKAWPVRLHAVTCALVVAPVGLQPYLHQNMAYRFDALSMAAALFLALWPASVKLRPGPQFMFSLAAILASLMLYQPAFSGFIVACVMVTAISFARATSQRENMATAAGGLAALGLYCLFVYWLKPLEDYVGYRSAIAPASNTLATVAENVIEALRMIHQHWKVSPSAYPSILILLLAVAGSSWLVVTGRPRIPRWAALAVCVSSGAAILIAIQAPQLLLRHPLWAPRTFMSVGVILAFAGMLAATAWGRFASAVAVVQCWSMLVFGYTLANALDNQGAYDRQIGTDLVYDAERLRGAHEITNSHVLGYLELGPMSKKAVEKYPILDEILRTFFEGGDWSATYLRTLGFDTQYQQTLTPTAEKAVCDQAPDIVSGRYRLYVVEKVLIIRFNNAKPPCELP